MDLSVVPYRDAEKDRVELVIGEGKAADPSISGGRYRECLRNHAAAIGGQAFDGCGEFMPAGSGGSLEALSCAACGCHRNFHRRDGGGGFPRRQLLLPPPPPAPFPAFFPHPLPLPLPYGQIRPNPANFEASRAGSETPPRREEEQNLASARARKRHRTRFTAEQKEKMQAFAEKLGWRIQKHDDAALQEFCVEVGVKRHVLKVWMHNNKNAAAAAKRDPATAAAAAAASQAIRV